MSGDTPEARVEQALQLALNFARQRHFHSSIACLEECRTLITKCLDSATENTQQEALNKQITILNARLKPLVDKLRNDPFLALKLNRDCSIVQVKKAYRSLALVFHPDKNNGTTVELFQVIQGAFESLRTNPKVLSKVKLKEPSRNTGHEHEKKKPTANSAKKATNLRFKKKHYERQQQRQYQYEQNQYPKPKSTSQTAGRTGIPIPGRKTTFTSQYTRERQRREEKETDPQTDSEPTGPRPQHDAAQASDRLREFWNSVQQSDSWEALKRAAIDQANKEAAKARKRATTIRGTKGKQDSSTGPKVEIYNERTLPTNLDQEKKTTARQAEPSVSSTKADSSPKRETPEPPDAPCGLKMRSRTSRSITLSWAKEKGFASTKDEIKCYELQFRQGIFPWVTAGSSIRSTICRKNNLEPASEYSFKVRACSKAGLWGPFGHPMTFATEADQPGKVNIASVYSDSETSAVVTWEPAIENGSVVYFYELQIRTVEPGTRPAQEWTSASASVRGTACRKKNLIPGALYGFRVRAQNQVGWGPWGDPWEPHVQQAWTPGYQDGTGTWQGAEQEWVNWEASTRGTEAKQSEEATGEQNATAEPVYGEQGEGCAAEYSEYWGGQWQSTTAEDGSMATGMEGKGGEPWGEEAGNTEVKWEEYVEKEEPMENDGTHHMQGHDATAQVDVQGDAQVEPGSSASDQLECREERKHVEAEVSTGETDEQGGGHDKAQLPTAVDVLKEAEKEQANTAKDEDSEICKEWRAKSIDAVSPICEHTDKTQSRSCSAPSIVLDVGNDRAVPEMSDVTIQDVCDKEEEKDEVCDPIASEQDVEAVDVPWSYSCSPFNTSIPHHEHGTIDNVVVGSDTTIQLEKPPLTSTNESENKRTVITENEYGTCAEPQIKHPGLEVDYNGAKCNPSSTDDGEEAQQPHNAPLPEGWLQVPSRSRPGEFSYENKYTKERQVIKPTSPAKRTKTLLRETSSHKGDEGQPESGLPLGWIQVPSRSRPGEFSYENTLTGERQVLRPAYPAVHRVREPDSSKPEARTQEEPIGSWFWGAEGLGSTVKGTRAKEHYPAHMKLQWEEEDEEDEEDEEEDDDYDKTCDHEKFEEDVGSGVTSEQSVACKEKDDTASSGSQDASEEEEEEEDFFHGEVWLELRHEGRLYYYNTFSGYSTSERPHDSTVPIIPEAKIVPS